MFSKLDIVHNGFIHNFAWAEPEMKIVTACSNKTSKLLSVTPSGTLLPIKVFEYDSPVTSVMFCPGSSGMYMCKIYLFYFYLYVI